MGVVFQWITLYLQTIHNVYYKASIKRFYTAIATGLCGSITTFSQWQQESILDLSMGSVGSFFMKQINGLLFSYAAFQIGRHLYLCIYSLFRISLRPTLSSIGSIHGQAIAETLPRPGEQPIIVTLQMNPATVPTRGFYFQLTQPRQIFAGIIEFLLLFVFFGLIIAIIVLCSISNPVQVNTFSLVFAPIGAITRFLVLKLNTKTRAKIPIFTVIINVSGSIMASILYHSARRSRGDTVIAWLNALTIGYCGCLTTVSSMIQDIHVQSTLFRAYSYYFLSILLTLAPLVIVNVCFLYA
jgi:CrcB protein